jgi:hypothetical protein
LRESLAIAIEPIRKGIAFKKFQYRWSLVEYSVFKGSGMPGEDMRSFWERKRYKGYDFLEFCWKTVLHRRLILGIFGLV